MIREFNIENNELVTREGSPLIEITHFNDENEIKKKETYTVGHFLKEAKELVDAAPKVLKESISEAEANEMKAKLEEAGAEVELK